MGNGNKGEGGRWVRELEKAGSGLEWSGVEWLRWYR